MTKKRILCTLAALLVVVSMLISGCGKEVEEPTVEPTTQPHTHTLKQMEEKAPTAEEDGWQAYEYCTVCDYTTKVVIPATGVKDVPLQNMKNEVVVANPGKWAFNAPSDVTDQANTVLREDGSVALVLTGPTDKTAELRYQPAFEVGSAYKISFTATVEGAQKIAYGSASTKTVPVEGSTTVSVESVVDAENPFKVALKEMGTGKVSLVLSDIKVEPIEKVEAKPVTKLEKMDYSQTVANPGKWTYLAPDAAVIDTEKTALYDDGSVKLVINQGPAYDADAKKNEYFLLYQPTGAVGTSYNISFTAHLDGADKFVFSNDNKSSATKAFSEALGNHTWKITYTDTVDAEKPFKITLREMDTGVETGKKVITATISDIQVITHEHTLSAAATCTEDQICTTCNEVIAKKLGHSIQVESSKAPTCTENGWTKEACTRCGHNSSYATYALGHAYAWVTDKEATTTETGLKHEQCTRSGCDAKRNEGTVIEIIDPNKKEIAVLLENKKNAEVAANPGVWAYNAPTGVADAEKTAEYTDGSVALVVTKNSTGTMELRIQPNFAVGEYYKISFTATVEGANKLSYGSVKPTVIPVEGSTDVTVELPVESAMPFKVGIREMTGDSASLVLSNIQITPHEHTPSEATCTEDQICVICKEVLAEKTGHTEETVAGTAPSCTETGLTEGKKCSVCDTFTVSQEIIPALGHDEQPQAAKAPTCTEIGWDAYVTCSGCDYTTYAEKAALDHDFDWVIDQPATTTAPGVKHEECTREGCDAQRSHDTVIDILECAHTGTISAVFANGATCTKDGNSAYWTCSACLKYFSDAAGQTQIAENSWVIPASGHSEETVPGQAASCTVPGLTEGKKCSVCDIFTINQETIPAPGHDFGATGDAPSCAACGDANPNLAPSAAATFTFGANGNAQHADGSKVESYTETVNGYTLDITSNGNCYTGGFDATGESCLKMGSSSKTGSFTFTVAQDVTKVVIYVAQYKANATNVGWTVGSADGSQAIETASNNGEYTAIEIDTSVDKKITFRTADGGVRCMINTIEFYV